MFRQHAIHSDYDIRVIAEYLKFRYYREREREKERERERERWFWSMFFYTSAVPDFCGITFILHDNANDKCRMYKKV